jgi:hypothetical protein
MEKFSASEFLAIGSFLGVIDRILSESSEGLLSELGSDLQIELGWVAEACEEINLHVFASCESILRQTLQR